MIHQNRVIGSSEANAQRMFARSHQLEVRSFFAIDPNFAQLKVFYIFDYIGFGYSLKVAIHDANLLQGSIFEAAKIERILRLFGLEIADADVTHNRQKLSRLSLLIKVVNTNRGCGNLTNLNVTDMDVLQPAAAHSIVLDPHGIVQA